MPRANTRRATSTISAGSGNLPGARIGAGEATDRRLDHDHVARSQGRDVGSGGGVLPHLGVHRRGEHHRTPRGEQNVREQVVSPAVRRASQQIGSSRHHQHEIGLLPEPHVHDVVHVVEQHR